jgi:hypothetical protein
MLRDTSLENHSRKGIVSETVSGYAYIPAASTFSALSKHKLASDQTRISKGVMFTTYNHQVRRVRRAVHASRSDG